MYELDHMLNGKGSRSHLEEIAQEVKLEKLSRDAENDEKNEKSEVSPRSIFASAVLMITRWG
jgi:hypothetical protein